ncbi:hypothetical protein MTP99_013113 [Tenebrio molitor]|nr:hypothetical protein MTP99_013113 [Tenebrio molitor]
MRSDAILALVLCVQSVKLPPNFQKCNRNNPGLKQCVLRAAQDGIPQLTRPFDNLHPFFMSELSIGAGTGPVAVDQKFRNCSVYGYHRMKVDKFD